MLTKLCNGPFYTVCVYTVTFDLCRRCNGDPGYTVKFLLASHHISYTQGSVECGYIMADTILNTAMASKVNDSTTDTTGINATTEASYPLCSIDDPFSYQIFQNISDGRIVLLTLACILTLLTIIIFMEAVYFVQKHLPTSSRRIHIIWILGLFPAYSFTSLLALMVPRSHFIASIHSSLYLSVALYSFVLLIFDYYGGFDAAVVILAEEKASIAAPPVLCCCVCCLPKVKVTSKLLNIMKRLVFQMALVGPIVRFISSVLWTDGRFKPGKVAFDEAYIYLNTILIVSSILGIYGLQVIYRISEKPLQEFRIRPKFFSLQVTVILANLQHPLLGILVTMNVIKCADPLASDTRANMLYDALIVLEMFLISIAARILFRRRSGNLDYLISRPSLKLIQKDNGEKEMGLMEKSGLAGSNNNSRSDMLTEKSKTYDRKADLYTFALSNDSSKV
ncbi:organic solute transporter subunit alpha-like [Glandiceps talaboti]